MRKSGFGGGNNNPDPNEYTAFRGEYASGTIYDQYDMVTHDGGTYVCLLSVRGVTPAEGQYWTQIAAPQGGAIEGIGKYYLEFSHTDYAGGSLSIGSIPVGSVIQQTVVAVSSAFNAGFVTVGTDDAQGILLADNDVANGVGAYDSDNHYAPDETATYKIFFHGSPTTGAGAVIIYYL